MRFKLDLSIFTGHFHRAIIFAFSIAMHKSIICHFLKINLEFINMLIRGLWFENRNELVERCVNVKRVGVLVIKNPFIRKLGGA